MALLVGGLVGRNRSLRWSSVASVGEFIVMEDQESQVKLRGDAELVDLREKDHKIIGTDIITEAGEKIGEVHDLFHCQERIS